MGGKSMGKGARGASGSSKGYSEKSSSKGTIASTSKWEKSSRKKRKGCRDYEFDRRRHLQFDGADCSPNILDVAARMPELSLFVDLWERAGLDEIFECGGPFTVIAPTDNAFQAMDRSTFADLLMRSNKDDLEDLLLYHVLPNVMLANDFGNGNVEALNGDGVQVSVGSSLTFNQATVITTDVLGCNGVLHLTDSVLTDDRSDTVVPDSNCGEFNTDGSGNDGCSTNLLDRARQDDNLSRIVSMIVAADLEDVLSCGGSFTLLLPTNDAIINLGQDVINRFVDPSNREILRSMLLYHFLSGSHSISSFSAGPVDTLLTGTTIQVSVNPTAFDNSLVVTSDVSACNGLYHIVDTVLIPGLDGTF